MVRREKLEIIKDILKLCTTPQKKTSIVYGCNLNFKIIKKYLSWCFINGWLQNDGKFYETTALGKDYLHIIMPTLNTLELLV